MTSHIEVAERLGDAWGSRDADGVAGIFQPAGIRQEWALPGAVLRGREEISRHVRRYMEAVPDCTLLIRGAFADEDRLTVEWTFAGTQTGDLPGLPARGQPVELPGVSVCEVTDGLLVRESVYWDAATLLVAAGVLA
jgi:steroid delta-isomerase-like uncharacterized protein